MWSWQWEITQNTVTMCVWHDKGQSDLGVGFTMLRQSFVSCVHACCRVTGMCYHARLLSENQGDP